MEKAESLVDIDAGIRFVFCGLECALQVLFNPREIRRVFEDKLDDQRDEQFYIFHEDSKRKVFGKVNGDEPFDIWIQLECRDAEKILRHVIEVVDSHYLRWRKHEPKFD